MKTTPLSLQSFKKFLLNTSGGERLMTGAGDKGPVLIADKLARTQHHQHLPRMHRNALGVGKVGVTPPSVLCKTEAFCKTKVFTLA